MPTTPVYLEIGDKRAFACSLAWPGWTRAGKTEDRLDIRMLEVLSDVEHEMGEAAALEKDGVERDLQLELAAQPEAIEPGLRLDRREWPTDIGPVDLMCRDADDGWVAVGVDHGRRRHPVQRLVAAGVRVDEHGAVVLQHHEPRGLGEEGGQAAAVGHLTAGNDEAHGPADRSVRFGQVRPERTPA